MDLRGVEQGNLRIVLVNQQSNLRAAKNYTLSSIFCQSINDAKILSAGVITYITMTELIMRFELTRVAVLSRETLLYQGELGCIHPSFAQALVFAMLLGRDDYRREDTPLHAGVGDSHLSAKRE